jgi:hypothetical protein
MGCQYTHPSKDKILTPAKSGFSRILNAPRHASSCSCSGQEVSVSVASSSRVPKDCAQSKHRVCAQGRACSGEFIKQQRQAQWLTTLRLDSNLV